MDLLGRQPFILAVVPLGKIGIDDGGVAETRQLAGLSCSLHRADEDASERLVGEQRAQPFGEPTPVIG